MTRIVRPGIRLLFCAFFPGLSFAQQQQPVRINSLNDDSTMLRGTVYRYPQFEQGIIVFNNHQQAAALVNINRISGKMLYINTAGDTLEPASVKNISYLSVGKDTFRLDGGHVYELVTHWPQGPELYKAESIQYNGKEKRGAYGGYSSTTASSALNKVSDNNTVEKIGIDENQLYMVSVQYYLGKDSKFYPATKKNFYKLFPAKRKELDAYLEMNKVNFKKEDALSVLLNSMQQ